MYNPPACLPSPSSSFTLLWCIHPNRLANYTACFQWQYRHKSVVPLDSFELNARAAKIACFSCHNKLQVLAQFLTKIECPSQRVRVERAEKPNALQCQLDLHWQTQHSEWQIQRKRWRERARTRHSTEGRLRISCEWTCSFWLFWLVAA